MNTLKDWLDQESGRAASLARRLNVVPSFVHKMAMGEKPVPVQRMAAIEAFTGGAVTRQSLRPHDWQQIWPELAATEASHDQQ